MSERVGEAAAPQNLDAEETVLGAMMLAPRAVDAAVGAALEADHFYRPSHGLIFQAALDLHTAGLPVDAVTIADALARRPHGNDGSTELEAAGGKVRVAELAALVPATGNVGHHAAIVREEWQRRELIRAVQGLERDAWRGLPADEAMQRAERMLLDLRGRVERGRSTVVTAYEVAEYLDEKIRNPPADEPGVRGPFSFLPKFRPGRLYVLGGYAADGKTALAMQILRTAAQAGHRLGYVTIEMSWRDLADRLLATYGVPYRQAQSGRVLPQYMEAARNAIRELTRWGVDLMDDESADAAAVWRYQRLGRHEMVVVDHLHEIDWTERRDLEREVRGLRALARRADIPVLLLSQLSRPDKSFARPTMASFRETGVIEQSAALAFAIWRRRDEHGQPTDEAELLVLKNRYGRTGAYPLRFRGAEVRFVEVDNTRGDHAP